MIQALLRGASVRSRRARRLLARCFATWRVWKFAVAVRQEGLWAALQGSTRLRGGGLKVVTIQCAWRGHRARREADGRRQRQRAAQAEAASTAARALIARLPPVAWATPK
jgi:hypothetical protein